MPDQQTPPQNIQPPQNTTYTSSGNSGAAKFGFSLEDMVKFGVVQYITKEFEHFSTELFNAITHMNSLNKAAKKFKDDDNMRKAIEAYRMEFAKFKDEMKGHSIEDIKAATLDSLKEGLKTFDSTGTSMNKTLATVYGKSAKTLQKSILTSFDTVNSIVKTAGINSIQIGIAIVGSLITAFSLFENKLLELNKELIISSKNMDTLTISIINISNELSINDSEVINLYNSLTKWGFGLDIVTGKNKKFSETLIKINNITGIGIDTLAKYSATMRRGGADIVDITHQFKKMGYAIIGIAEVTATSRQELIRVTENFTQLGIILGKNAKDANNYSIEMAKVYGVLNDIAGKRGAESILTAIENITKGTVEGMKSAAMLAGTTIGQFNRMDAEHQLTAIINKVSEYGNMNYLVAEQIARTAGISTDALMSLHSTIKRLGKERALDELRNKMGLIDSSMTSVDEAWKTFMNSWSKTIKQLFQSLKSIGIILGAFIAPILKIVAKLLAGIALGLNKAVSGILKLKEGFTILASIILGGTGIYFAFKLLNKVLGNIFHWVSLYIKEGIETVFTGLGKGLAGFFKALETINVGSVLKGSAALLLLSLSLIPMAYGLQMFSKVSWKDVALGVIGVGVLIAAMAGLGALMSTGVGVFIGAAIIVIIGISLALASLGASAYMLGKGTAVLSSSLGSIGDSARIFMQNNKQLEKVPVVLAGFINKLSKISILPVTGKMIVISSFLRSLSGLKIPKLDEFKSSMSNMALGFTMFDTLVTSNIFDKGSSLDKFIKFLTKGNMFGLFDSTFEDAGQAIESMKNLKLFGEGLYAVINGFKALSKINIEPTLTLALNNLGFIVTELTSKNAPTAGNLPGLKYDNIGKVLDSLKSLTEFGNGLVMLAIGLRIFNTLETATITTAFTKLNAIALQFKGTWITSDSPLYQMGQNLSDMDINSFAKLGGIFSSLSTGIKSLGALTTTDIALASVALTSVGKIFTEHKADFITAIPIIKNLAEPLLKLSDSLMHFAIAAVMLEGTPNLEKILTLMNGLESTNHSFDATSSISIENNSEINKLINANAETNEKLEKINTILTSIRLSMNKSGNINTLLV